MATPRTPKPGAGQTPPIEDAEVVQDVPAQPAQDVSEAQDVPMPDREDSRRPEPAVFEEMAPIPDPAPDPAPQPEPVRSEPPPPRRASPVPLVLGGVVAAGIGFALAQVVPGGWPLAGIDTLHSRVAAQEAAIQSLTADLAAARAEVASLPAPVAPDLSGVEGRLAALDAALADLADRPAPPDPTTRIEAIEQRIATLESLPPGTGDGGADPAAMAALLREVSQLRTEVQAQQADQDRIAADLAAAAEAARASVAAAEAEAARLTAEAEAAAQKALLRAAVGRVVAALENGTAFAQPLDELVAGGVTVPEALVTAAEGLPTLLALQDAFADPARAALEASLRADMGEGAMERLATFLRSTTGARSLTPREGTDPDAVLSRAEGHLRAGDIAASLAELGGLPEPGQAAMADWVATATRRLAAQEAAAALVAQVEG
jgi:hypothetical protein